ncbi:MAG: lytic murein transglycosylase [Deltaproteobacteria bacterium]
MRLTLAATLISLTISPAFAATCGNDASGFTTWKTQFGQEAAAMGVKKKGLAALAGTSYATATIKADRGQKSFKLTLDEFLKKRGADTIIAIGRKKLKANPALYKSLEDTYGVPAGVLLAIHGMETGFGNFMGDANVLNAMATLTYDCRRPDFFTPHLVAALMLVDKGILSPATIGAMHGEVGHTQFLPGNVLNYGVDGDGDGRISLDGSLTDALASTANYLAKKGWQRGKGYQEGEANFAVIKEWNAAGVYQKAIALMGAKIDN